MSKYYYKCLDENNEIVSLEERDKKAACGDEYFLEITKEEYDSILAQLEKLWQDEQEQWQKENIDPVEFMQMIEGVL